MSAKPSWRHNKRFQPTAPLRGASLAALGAAEPVRYECLQRVDSVEKVGVAQARSLEAEKRTIDVSLREIWGSSVPELAQIST